MAGSPEPPAYLSLEPYSGFRTSRPHQSNPLETSITKTHV